MGKINTSFHITSFCYWRSSEREKVTYTKTQEKAWKVNALQLETWSNGWDWRPGLVWQIANGLVWFSSRWSQRPRRTPAGCRRRSCCEARPCSRLPEKRKNTLYIFLYFLQCCGFPGTESFRIPDPRSGVKRIPDPGSTSNNLSIKKICF